MNTFFISFFVKKNRGCAGWQRMGAWLCLSAVLSFSSAMATDYGDITAVAARVSDDYVRTKLADGSYPQETYAFGPGGVWGSALHDDSIDKLKFTDVAHLVAGPLAKRNYLPAKDPAKTKLLIMVYWGMTAGSADDPILHYSTLDGLLAFNPQRDQADLRNAKVLGYNMDDLMSSYYERGAASLKGKDMLEEIGGNRYFVVLMAYDFQLMWKEKKTKLLWETRYSIQQRGNDFDQTLASMTEYASRYFGQDSHGLVRRRLPIENIKINETQFIGFGSEANPAASDEAQAKRAPVPAQEGNRTTLPQPIARRIADYQREKDALQDALALKIKNQPDGMDHRRAIDSFNLENSARIASLKQKREDIRTELAQLAVANSSAAGGDKSMDSFLGNLTAEMREIAAPSDTHKP